MFVSAEMRFCRNTLWSRLFGKPYYRTQRLCVNVWVDVDGRVVVDVPPHVLVPTKTLAEIILDKEDLLDVVHRAESVAKPDSAAQDTDS